MQREFAPARWSNSRVTLDMETEPAAQDSGRPIASESMLRDLCECSALANPYSSKLLKGEEVVPTPASDSLDH